MPRTYYRDPIGRFCRKPAPTLIDAEVLRTLGAHRRPEILLTAEHELTVTITHPKLQEENHC